MNKHVPTLDGLTVTTGPLPASRKIYPNPQSI
jgi:hypothetical protein